MAKVFLLAVLSSLPTCAAAFPNYAILFKSTFTYLPSCTVCHQADSWENNDFGKQFRDEGRSLKALEKIANRDADGDAIANYLEILAKSNPGDPRSTPKRPGDWLKDAAIRPPKKLMKFAFPDADAYEVREMELRGERAKAVEKLWGAPLPDESRYAALFVALKEGKPSGAGTYLSVELPGYEAKPTLLFVAADAAGKLAYLKIIEYEGTPSLSKDKAWKDLLGKDAEAILKDAGIKGPPEEVASFKAAVRRGLLTVEAGKDSQ